MTVSWPEAVPAALAAMFWLVVAGVPACYALGLRGIAAWCAAPVVPAGVLGAGAVVAGWVRIAWSPAAALAAVLLATAGFLAISGTLRRLPADPPRVRVAALAGAVTGALLGSLILVRGLVTPGSVSWTWDTPFHYSALAHIRDSGDASSMSLGMLGDPRSEVTFYPAGWFDIASLIPQSTGAGIPVAANATAGATAALVWPLACVFLARQVFGRRPAPLAVIGVLSMGFSQFPWELFSWGALWPYSLGQALMPISLGLVLSLTGKAADDAVGPARASVLLIVAVAALGFAHPAAVFGLGVLALFPVGWAVAEWVARQHRAGRTRRAVLVVGGVAVVVAAGVAGAASTSMVDSMRATNWPPTHTAAAAFGEILLNATNSDRALWVLSAVMVVGAVVFWRTRELRWIVVAHLGSGLFYIATASIQSTLTKSVTAFWFNDSHRLAAMLAVTAPLMTAAGAVWIAELAGRSAWFAAALERLSALRFRPANLAVIAPVLLVVLALMGTTKGLYQGRHALVLRDIHQPTREHTGKLRFYRQLEHDVPPDAVVANNPEDGSPLIWAVAHRRVMLPHLTANDSPDRAYLAHTLTHAARDPRACRLARQLRVGYLITDGTLPEFRRREYPGLQDYPGMRGFRLIRAAGPLKLYQLTACGPESAGPAAPAGRSAPPAPAGP